MKNIILIIVGLALTACSDKHIGHESTASQTSLQAATQDQNLIPDGIYVKRSQNLLGNYLSLESAESVDPDYSAANGNITILNNTDKDIVLKAKSALSNIELSSQILELGICSEVDQTCSSLSESQIEIKILSRQTKIFKLKIAATGTITYVPSINFITIDFLSNSSFTKHLELPIVADRF